MKTADSSQRVRNVWWEETPSSGADEMPVVSVGLLDQSLLPQQFVPLLLEHERQVAEAIKTLKVRGAPAIGITAAYGLALAVHRLWRERRTQNRLLPLAEALAHIETVAEMLAQTRPTAVNLAWALRRLHAVAEQVAGNGEGTDTLVRALVTEAQAIADEDAAACLRMGQYGAELIADGASLLTHCNAGALATGGLGTALAPFYVAQQSGKRLHVFVDETRPILQGARLTAWELQQAGIPLTLITDNMAGYFMRKGKIQAVFVGADRIAANGDVANKIGTYSVAVLARAHQIPFYVVAPCSTIDLALSTGEEIPIEQRDAAEVTTVRGVEIAPVGIAVANPAFDVTPNDYVTAIITERGVVRPPYMLALRQAVEKI
jgi:methylthioribose-1-phosphate isomerase